MKKYRITFTDSFEPSPMSFWVHRNVNGDCWHDADEFEPPLPKPIPGRGYSRLHVECDGISLEFASLHELDQMVAVLSMNPLPSTRSLARQRHTSAGPNSHWLSRLPGRAKSLRFRRKLVGFLQQIRPEYAELDL